MGLLARLVDLEADVLYREPPGEGEDRIGALYGNRPVVFSAPHGAVHTRHGGPKEEEEFTAAMVCLVAELAGAHALYARRRLPTDPNWERGVPYKGWLREIVARHKIELVLDLHGMAPERDLGIALGTLRGESCPGYRDGIIDVLSDHGFRSDDGRLGGCDRLDHLDVDETFTGAGVGGQETITSFTWRELGVPCAQLELHPALRVVERREDATLPRPYRGDAERIRRVVDALCEIVGAVS